MPSGSAGAMTSPSCQCKFFVTRKRRFCKFQALPGSDFCGEHLPEGVSTAKGARIKCPLDPSHTVFEKELESHLLVCNSRPKVCDYATENVNMSPQDLPNVDFEVGEKFKDCLYVTSLVAKIQPFLTKYKRMHRLELPEPLAGGTKTDIQNAAISAFALPPNFEGDYALIEVGAGKAKLSYHFVNTHAENPPCKVYLIDRARPKGKFDQKIKTLCGHSERILCDLRDIDFTKLPIDSQNLVVIGKHACGEATCFSLSAVQRATTFFPGKQFHICIAPCCHQVCDYGSFCYPAGLREVGLSCVEFSVIKKLSSWGICGMASDQLIGGLKKRDIGAMMKEFIDLCRVNMLESIGFKARLQKYCDPSVSPENRLIVGSSTSQEDCI